jgi:hypothetical protein
MFTEEGVLPGTYTCSPLEGVLSRVHVGRVDIYAWAYTSQLYIGYTVYIHIVCKLIIDMFMYIFILYIIVRRRELTTP